MLVPKQKNDKPVLKPLVMEMAVVRVHRTTRLEKADLQLGKPMRTTVARSVIDAAQWAASDNEAREIVAAACQQKRVTPREILDASERQPRAKRRKLIRETAVYAEGGHWTADMLRQNEVWLKGDRVLRFPAHLLRTQPDLVMEQIRKALQG